MIRHIKSVRKYTTSGNYEQAAREAKCDSTAEHFKTQFTYGLEQLYNITYFIVEQIGPTTGASNSSKL